MKLLLLASVLTLFTSVQAPAAAREKPTPRSASRQAFSYSNIVAHFKRAGFRATEAQPRCTILFEGEWRSREVYNYCLIVVENSDEDVQVTFYLTDAHEMNWVTEFLDAPFFTPAETQALFALMNRTRDTRNRRIGRFRVDYHYWEPKHAEILVFSFTPLR